jgi:hypothetical protein
MGRNNNKRQLDRFNDSNFTQKRCNARIARLTLLALTVQELIMQTI